MSELRVDLVVTASLVEPGSRVLDLGCGNGELLNYLIQKKGCKGYGVEISEDGVANCIRLGLPVFQGDLDQGLDDHQDDAFDYVILSQTLQTIPRPEFVLQEMRRVGKQLIVSLPNFAHWRIRLSLLFKGRMPTSDLLPHTWYDTPNIHMCSILDFRDLHMALGLKKIERIALTSTGNRLSRLLGRRAANLFAPMVVFLLKKESV